MNLFLLGGLLVVASAMLAALGYRGREQVVGIDLGTTFSVVAVRHKGQIKIVPDRLSGKPLVPSAVTYLDDGRVVVGDGAVALRSSNHKQTIFNAKRFIGRPMADVTADAARHPFVVAPNASDASGREPHELAAGFSIPRKGGSADVWVSPIDVGAEVVRHMKRSITDFMGYEMSRAVICVPAKFGSEETKATKVAFEQAGFKVMRVLEEPTAAAVAYNLHKKSGVRYTVVYDIGGGTLDTSLLYMNGKSVSVLGVAGDNHLGGSDFDETMRSVLEAKLGTAKVVQSDAEVYSCHEEALLILGEHAKIELSNHTSTKVRCRADDGAVREISVTREEFEHACADLFARAIRPVEKVLEDQHMTIDNVDDVVLVGGASRMPQLRTLLTQFFGPDRPLHTEIDPDVTVAYGAANIID